MTGETFSHIPVMLNECIEGLNISPGKLYADGTLGGCGHSVHILEKGGRLIGIDRDETAIRFAEKKLTGYGATLVNDNYSNIVKILENLGISGIDGALLDLGVSSYQLDTPERGFSYRFDAPLDMRMNRKEGITAKEVVNTFDGKELEQIFFDYGEEKYSKSIVRKIIEARQHKEIETTFELVDIIKSAMPPKVRWEGKHPAKRVFQAIRICVNDELGGLKKALNDFCSVLNSGGRFAVITFHSLEDRLVKNTFANLAKGCDCPKDFPVCVCGKKPLVKQVTKKPVLPSEDEIDINPRSGSAKLRIVEKI